ncbi:MAG: HD domain-containing protein [Oscillospiraceae bacterium]|nr:HD domain-containing protein [Oscillospiraceae bacterium]
MALECPNTGVLDGEENRCYQDFSKRADEFVKKFLDDYKPNRYTGRDGGDNVGSKVIHDPVWGTTLFYRWELQLLDSPLLQRLRNINQLGLAASTYPSARHTRFEHTLGVMSVVTKMVDHINQRERTPVIGKRDFYTLRLAALLHDVGHCFCSHLSESIYGKMNEFVLLKKSFHIFKTAKEHEIFAYIIINTPTFKRFLQENIQLWDPALDYEQLLVEIGYMIVGANLPKSKIEGGGYEKKYYLTQIINGQYDADKLDYLRRDSYTAGLALTYDIDRFLYKIQVRTKEENVGGETVRGKHLVIPTAGISAVEEMAFSQLMLASYIYQHQKILAVDALIQDVVQGLVNNEKLTHPCDFLNYCDNDLLGIYKQPADGDFNLKISDKTFDSVTRKTMGDIVKRIKNRELPKRALTVNPSVLLKDHEQKPYPVPDIADRLQNIQELREDICAMATQISNELPKNLGGKEPIDKYDIHISIPKTSIAKDLSNALVITPTGKFVSLSEIVRLSDWADAFAWHKWNAYVFSRADVLPIVSIAAKIVFEKRGLCFDEDTVFSGIKQNEKIQEATSYLKENNKYPS